MRRIETRMTAVVAAGADGKSVHQLRTTVRRTSECLRSFEDLFPEGAAGRVRRRLKGLMDLAAEVRNRDSTAELFRQAGLLVPSEVFTRLEGEQQAGRTVLLATLAGCLEKGQIARWQEKLNGK